MDDVLEFLGGLQAVFTGQLFELAHFGIAIELELGKEFFRAIAYANVCSYIFLSFLFPFSNLV